MVAMAAPGLLLLQTLRCPCSRLWGRVALLTSREAVSLAARVLVGREVLVSLLLQRGPSLCDTDPKAPLGHVVLNSRSSGEQLRGGALAWHAQHWGWSPAPHKHARARARTRAHTHTYTAEAHHKHMKPLCSEAWDGCEIECRDIYFVAAISNTM